MIFAIVELQTTPQNRTIALDALERFAPDIRAMEGNVAFRAVATPRSVLILQEWDSGLAFDAYRNSALFAEMGAKLKPLASQTPSSRLFEEVIAS